MPSALLSQILRTQDLRQKRVVIGHRGRWQKYIARPSRLFYISAMMTLTEVESLAFELPEQQRATLASRILDTLPPLFTDSDDGIAEAEHRDSELDADPSKGINLEQFDRLIAQRR